MRTATLITLLALPGCMASDRGIGKEQQNITNQTGPRSEHSLPEMLSLKLANCWVLPADSNSLRDAEVTYRVWLDLGGRLQRPPEVILVKGLEDDSAKLVQSMLMAIRRCAPYPEAVNHMKKAGLEYIDFNFNVAEFTGG